MKFNINWVNLGKSERNHHEKFYTHHIPKRSEMKS